MEVLLSRRIVPSRGGEGRVVGTGHVSRGQGDFIVGCSETMFEVSGSGSLSYSVSTGCEAHVQLERQKKKGMGKVGLKSESIERMRGLLEELLT